MHSTALRTDPPPSSLQQTMTGQELHSCPSVCVTAEEEQHHLGQKFYVGGGGRLTGDVWYNATLPWAVWGGGEQDGVITSPLLSTSSQPEVDVFLKAFFFTTLY